MASLAEAVTSAILAVKTGNRDDVRREFERGVQEAIAAFEKQFDGERHVLCSVSEATRNLLRAIDDSFRVSEEDVWGDMPENVSGLIMSHLPVRALARWSCVSKAFQQGIKSGLFTAPAFRVKDCDWDDGAPEVSNFTKCLPQLRFVAEHCPNLRSLYCNWGYMPDLDEGGKVVPADHHMYEEGLKIVTTKIRKLERLFLQYPDPCTFEDTAEAKWFTGGAFKLTSGLSNLRVLHLEFEKLPQAQADLSTDGLIGNLPSLQFLKLELNDGALPVASVARLLGSVSSTLEILSITAMEPGVEALFDAIQNLRLEKLRVVQLDFSSNGDMDNTKYVRLHSRFYATVCKIANPDRIQGLELDMCETLQGTGQGALDAYKSIISEAGKLFPNLRWFGSVSFDYDAYHKPGMIKNALAESLPQFIRETFPHLRYFSTDNDDSELKVSKKEFLVGTHMDIDRIYKLFLGKGLCFAKR